MSISKGEHEAKMEKEQKEQKEQAQQAQQAEQAEEQPTSRSSEDTHQFHSPLNSNAIITITTSEPIDIQPLLIQFQGQFQLLSTTSSYIKLKFMDKAQAQEFQSKFNGTHPNIEINIEFDALTHPGNIYVRGLGPEITTEDLFKIFEPFGEITSSKIVNDEFGRSKGYGFINYTNGTSADEAIDKLNGLLVNGSKLYLNHHIAKKERIQRIDFEKSNFTNLYIKNLPIDYTLEKFESLFKEFGEINSSFLPELNDQFDQQNGGVPKRFGFINFKNHESAIAAIESLNDREIAPGIGQFLSVSRAQRRDERNEHFAHPPTPYGYQLRNNSISPQPAPILFHSPPGSIPPPITQPSLPLPRSTPPHSIESITSPNFAPNQIIQQQVAPQITPSIQASQGPVPQVAPVAPTTIPFPMPGPNHQPSNLYVRNLTPNIDDSALHSAFAPFGIIISAKIMTTEDGESRGYGFVCYRTSPEASRALIAMNGNVLDGQMLHVSFAQKNNKKKFGGKQITGPSAGPPSARYYYNTPYQDPSLYHQFYPPPGAAPARGYYNGYKPYRQQGAYGANTNVSNGQYDDDNDDEKMVKLSSEIAALDNEEAKISKLSKFIIVPKLLNLGDDPSIVEEKSTSFIQKQVDHLKQGDKENQEDEDNVYLDLINDWVNDEKSLVKQLQEWSI